MENENVGTLRDWEMAYGFVDQPESWEDDLWLIEYAEANGY